MCPSTTAALIATPAAAAAADPRAATTPATCTETSDLLQQQDALFRARFGAPPSMRDVLLRRLRATEECAEEAGNSVLILDRLPSPSARLAACRGGNAARTAF